MHLLLYQILYKFQNSIYVAIPFTLSRASVHSREAFVKADKNGEWREIPSTEVTYENHKVRYFITPTFHISEMLDIVHSTLYNFILENNPFQS